MPRLPARKRTRRRRGSGSLYWHKTLSYWVATLPPSLGSRSTYFDTKADAEAWLEKELARDDRSSVELLGNYLRHWYEANEPRWRSENTRATYLNAIERLKPLYRIALRDLKPGHVERWCLDQLQAGMAQSTIRNTRGLLRAALNDAVRDELLPRVPLSRLRLPTVQQDEDDASSYSFEEARRILAAAEQHPLGLLSTLALLLGLRIGELVTLEWSGVDLGAGTLLVQRTAGRSVTQPQDQTKSRRARRVPLIAPLPDQLRCHRAQQPASTRWVFPGKHPRNPLSVTTAGHALKAIMTAAGVPVRSPHTLRRSTSSLLHALGVPDATRATILGHASLETTRRHYTSDLTGQAAEALSRLAQVLLPEPASASKTPS